MKHLTKLNKHDIDTRWYAILYINGEFFESGNHAGCLKEYMDIYNIEYSNNMYFRRDTLEAINESNIIKECAFLHLVDEETAINGEDEGIYVETDTLQGITIDQLISKIKHAYPSYNIYDDNVIIEKTNYEEKYKKLATIKTEEYTIPITPDYPQDYFEKRNPKRLKKIKELHDNNKYLSFKELIKPTMIAGLAMDKINRMPGDTVTVYHGTSAAFIHSILSNGLSENFENSYQSHGANYGLGIWVTLNYDGAKNYAVHSARGWTRDNQQSEDEEITQYFNFGAIIEMEVPKDSLNDEGSASNNNLKSNDIISPDKIKQIYVFDINSGQTWNWF